MSKISSTHKKNPLLLTIIDKGAGFFLLLYKCYHKVPATRKRVTFSLKREKDDALPDFSVQAGASRAQSCSFPDTPAHSD